MLLEVKPSLWGRALAAARAGRMRRMAAKERANILELSLLREEDSKGCVDSGTGACSTEESTSKWVPFYTNL